MSVVEAIDTFDSDRPAWIANVLAAADSGRSQMVSAALACAYRALPNGTLVIDESSAAAQRHQPGELKAILGGLQIGSAWLVVALLPTRRRNRARHAGRARWIPRASSPTGETWRGGGVRDGLNIACTDLYNEGLLLSLARPEVRSLEPEARSDLVRVGTHLLAAFRLRRIALPSTRALLSLSDNAAGGPAMGGAVEAVLTPEGEVVDAAGEAELDEARRALRIAVRGVERARWRARRSSHEALKVWRGLVAARWTLVDEFDESDGSRYVVARVNVPRPAGMASLTPTERVVVTYTARGFSTKETAYALGLSDATVRVLIMRAARRCGARNRAELLAMARGPMEVVDTHP